jgi:AcrR family transcriptional regulator
MPEPRRVAFQRARTAEEKQQRRESIRDAARELALRDGVRNVTLAGIAQRVGLAPSNVLAYFGSREDIYLDLLADAWTDWTNGLEQALKGLPPEPSTVAEAITEALTARPLFCDLVAYIAPSYEHNASPEAVRDISIVGRDNVERFDVLFVQLLTLTLEQSRDLLSAILSFTAYWWMRSHPSANLDAARALEPNIVARFDFASPLTRMITTFIDGQLIGYATRRRT